MWNSNYLFSPATVSVQSDRPAFGGTCYSLMTAGSSYLVTAYGSSSVTATSYVSYTVTNAGAYAYPIDGFAYGVAELASLSTTVTNGVVSSTSGSATSGATSSSSTNSTASAASTASTSTSTTSHGVAIGVGVGVPLAAVFGGLAAFLLWRRNKQRKAAAHGAVGSDAGGNLNEEHEPKNMAMSQQEMGVDMPLRADEEHELHSYATPYEMGAENHYEMEGSNQFKR